MAFQLTPTRFGDLAALQIDAADGAQAIVTLFGAHLVSWKTADGAQRLFCSARSRLDGSSAIRGGVPVIFPQFAARGNGLRHGFARISNWTVGASGQDGAAAFAEFTLTSGDLAPALARAWPDRFELRLRVALHADMLELALTVRNTGTEWFGFSAALHGYYLIDRLDRASIDGLQQVRYSDQLQDSVVQEEAALHFIDKLDRIYRQVPGPLILRAGAATVTLQQHGFADTVVWNPGAADSAALTDMHPDEFRRFVCIEPAAIEPVTLAAGSQWSARQRISANSIP